MTLRWPLLFALALLLGGCGISAPMRSVDNTFETLGRAAGDFGSGDKPARDEQPRPR